MNKTLRNTLAWQYASARMSQAPERFLEPDATTNFKSFKPAAIQTLLGYGSAALGLLCELVIAARFGATAQTDTYRWAALLPFYATTFFGGVLIPVLFRSRLFPRGTSSLYVLRLSTPGRYRYRLMLVAAALVLAAFDFAALAFGFSYPGRLALFLQSALFAGIIVLYAVLSAPLFFQGWIWLNTLVTALLNLILLGALLSPSARFYLDISSSMGVAGLILLCLPWIALRCIENSVFEHLADSCAKIPPTAASHVAITGLANLASMASTTIYFSALTLSGTGLLSIYITTQKAGLVLGVPANAIFNKFIRDDFMAAHQANVVARALKAVRPILIVSPIFALLAFCLLTVVYGINPVSSNAHLIAAGCAAGAALAALTSCMTLLTAGRASARHGAFPALVSVAIAIAGATLVVALHGPTWSIAVPMFGAALASSIGLTWISWRVGHSFRQIWIFAATSFAIAGSMMSLLPRMPLLQIAEWAYVIRTFVRLHMGS
jgi:hypothetical protein